MLNMSMYDVGVCWGHVLVGIVNIMNARVHIYICIVFRILCVLYTNYILSIVYVLAYIVRIQLAFWQANSGLRLILPHV